MIKLSSPSNDLTTSNNTVFNFTYDSTSSKYGYLNSSGTFVPFEDSSDATASAATIISGYTAYVNGSKITGEASSGTDTSDGTITNAEQILAGLVGYSKGIRYVGTGIMKPNYEVIIIYNGTSRYSGRVTLNIHRYRDNSAQSVTSTSLNLNYTVSKSDYIDSFKASDVGISGISTEIHAYIHFTKKVNYIQTLSNIDKSGTTYYLPMNYTNGIIKAATEVERKTYMDGPYYYNYTLIIWSA